MMCPSFCLSLQEQYESIYEALLVFIDSFEQISCNSLLLIITTKCTLSS